MSAELLHRLFVTRPAAASIAFDAAGGVITMEQMRRDVAGWLAQLEAQTGGRWALAFADSYRFACALFAVLLSGRRAILLDHTRRSEFSDLAEHFDGLLADAPIAHAPLCPVLAPPPAADWVPRPISSDEHAALTFFTSGSTGQPKPIQKRVAQIVREVDGLRARWGDTIAGSEVVATVTHQHFYGFIFRMFLPLRCEVPFAAFMLRTPEDLRAASSARRVLISSPALLKRLDGPPAHEGYRLIFSAGGQLPAEAADACERLLGRRPIDILGSSENGAMAWRSPRGDATPWQPLPGVEIGADAEGRLRVRSPYQNLDGLDEDGWQRSDDAIELLSEGGFQLLGRLDRIVKIEDQRVSLDEVERSLQRLEAVLEAAVIKLQRGQRLELGAVLVLTEQGRAALAHQRRGQFTLNLRRALRGELQPLAIPRRFRFAEAIPTNPQGKRLVTELEKLFA